MTRREHDLKTWPIAFVAVRDGLKPWELRKNDRDYRVGDLLRLREWRPDLEDYSGAIEERLVTWMLEGPAFGLPEGYVIMSLAKADQVMAPEREAAAAWAWLASDRRLSVEHYAPVYGDDDDEAEEWRVHRATGNINDREWGLLGVGATPLEAVEAARRTRRAP